MKGFVKLCAFLLLAMAVVAGGSEADAQSKKRKPTLFEQMFGGASGRDVPRQKKRRLLSRSEMDAVGPDRLRLERNARADVKVIREKAVKNTRQKPVPAADPEPDPGFGMGNLRYTAPTLVSLNGIKLEEERPFDPAAAGIHDQLSGSGPSLRVSPSVRDAVAVQYKARGFRPVWLENGRLSARGESVLALLAAADTEGLDSRSYLPSGLSTFDSTLPAWDPAAMARLDIDLFAAALRYAQEASGGRFDPSRLSLYHDVRPETVPLDRSANVLAWSPYAVDYLKGLHPQHPAYASMKQALAERRARSSAQAFTQIPDGKVVRPGGKDERLPAVRDRLQQLGYVLATLPPGGDPQVLDEALAGELAAFQKASGIKTSSALGPQTIRALNADSTAREEAVLLNNMERMRWLPKSLGERHVFVNQPAFQAWVMENGKAAWSTRVIVGKPMTQTSVFHDEMELVVFNPSWGIPASIIAKEYLPKLRRDPGYLDRLGYQVVNQSGKVVPSRSIRWSSYGSKVPFGIQQPPGAKNALGEIKFMFPNSHDIYMHDTPSRELFAEDVRAFSHGCVRVENPRDFAAVLLGWSAEEVAAHIATPKTETVKLIEKIPVHLTYFTAWPDETGRIVFFDDIYGRDRAMEDGRSGVAVAQR